MTTTPRQDGAARSGRLRRRPSMPRAVAVIAVAALAALVPLLVSAQGRRSTSSSVRQVAEYTGNLTFTRIAFSSGGLRGFGFGGGDAWAHDYPAADRNVGAIIDYITLARVNL